MAGRSVALLFALALVRTASATEAQQVSPSGEEVQVFDVREFTTPACAISMPVPAGAGRSNSPQPASRSAQLVTSALTPSSSVSLWFASLTHHKQTSQPQLLNRALSLILLLVSKLVCLPFFWCISRVADVYRYTSPTASSTRRVNNNSSSVVEALPRAL